MISNPLTGAAYVVKGLRLINKPGIRPFVIIPLLINSLLFAGLIWFLGNEFSSLMQHWLPVLPDWLSWLSGLLWLLFAIAALIILFFGFTLLANLVSAPFNSYLSAAVEKQLHGHAAEDTDSFMQVLSKTLASELKKIRYFILWAIPLFILGFIPFVNLFTPALWLLFGAWMMSLEYADYPLGNQGLGFPDIRRRLREKTLLSLGFGATVMLASMIPVFNFLIMPAAVAGATIMRLEQFPDAPA
ncbi:Sulfate transporter, CysZ-type [hydrothermal vent metagenome]|uniref:Sulfate transporter, CysZ-type n=1 Tax=hydrothermal vent metagenome TaxID=652676 RepID=A0A3B1C9U9_9ZZZZ